MLVLLAALTLLLLLLTHCVWYCGNSGSKVPATCRSELAAFLQQKQGKSKQEQPFSSFLATTLMLISELAQGSASGYEPYFKTLPESTYCLINWSPEDKALLQGVLSCGSQDSNTQQEQPRHINGAAAAAYRHCIALLYLSLHNLHPNCSFSECSDTPAAAVTCAAPAIHNQPFPKPNEYHCPHNMAG